MSITEERKKKVNFSNKYYVTPAKFVRKKGSGIEINDASQKCRRTARHLNFGKIVKVKAYASEPRIDEAIFIDFVG